jgi:hypothetical protein
MAIMPRYRTSPLMTSETWCTTTTSPSGCPISSRSGRWSLGSWRPRATGGLSTSHSTGTSAFTTDPYPHRLLT